MRQLGELNKNGAKEFEELGVEVVAVFREEREGLAGLKKIKVKTKAPFTLAIDTPKKATAAYSNGRMKFHNYVVDKNGVIQGVIDGSLRSRAQAVKLLEIVKSTESDSAGMAESSGGASGGDKAAVELALNKYADGINQVKTELLRGVIHPDLRLLRFKDEKTRLIDMDVQKLLQFAQKNKAADPSSTPTKIQVLNITGNMASAKLSSTFGTDLIQLLRDGDKWRVVQILSGPNDK